jgi:undecaprenyl-diphosphatase
LPRAGVLSDISPFWSVWSPFAAVVVGLVQGLLEWLPVSSQGNLVILMLSLFGLEPSEALSLSVYLHLGTGLAALIYFRREIRGMIRRDTENDRRLLRFLTVSTAVTGVVGLPIFLFARVASSYGEALLVLTGVALLITGVVQKRSRPVGADAEVSLGDADGLFLGVAQGFSAIPGLSRSGVTTSALLFKGCSGEEAFRVSFLMSVPASFAAALGLMIVEGAPALEPGFLLAMASSFISALFSIDALLGLARRVRLWGLCVALGIIALLPLLQYLF